MNESSYFTGLSNVKINKTEKQLSLKCLLHFIVQFFFLPFKGAVCRILTLLKHKNTIIC